MNLDSNLLRIGNLEIKKNHLLLFSILSLSFSISFLIRIIPGIYGWELNEFDPFFNFRATEHIVENGLISYFSWNDNLSWYPVGRDISNTSQVVLHITTAISYWIFGGGSSLYDFTIIFPVIIGSLTTIPIFLFVRVFGGNGAGLISSLLFSVATPIIFRGSLGWFKSEPLGLLLGIIGLYLFLTGIKNRKSNSTYLRLIFAGIILTFGISAWGGIQFFVIPIALFIFTLPFIQSKNLTKSKILLFSISLLLSTLLFERPGINFIIGHLGLLIISSTIFSISMIYIKNLENFSIKKFLMISSIIIITISVSFIIIDTFVLDGQYSFRYYNAMNPFLTNDNPLIDSISEHQTKNIYQSFFFENVLMIFSGIGVWFLFSSKSKKNNQNKFLLIFSLIFGILGVYVSSTFLRLEVFTSISLILLSSIGIVNLLKSFKNLSLSKNKKILYNSIFCTGLFLLLLTPLVLNPISPITIMSSTPSTILNGGTTFSVSSDDWITTLNWIKNNTEKNSVIMSWWDYGYWIQTLGERATISDNSTLDSKVIKKTAQILISNPELAWKTLSDLEVDYLVIFVSATRLPTALDDNTLYILGGGADETKKGWIIQIAEENPGKFLYSDGISSTDYFWNETLLGQMIPFSNLGYVDLSTQQDFSNYVPGTIGVYKKDIKFSNEDPFNLIYSSPSFNSEKSGPVIAVLVYEVNKNYNPVD